MPIYGPFDTGLSVAQLGLAAQIADRAKRITGVTLRAILGDDFDKGGTALYPGAGGVTSSFTAPNKAHAVRIVSAGGAANERGFIEPQTDFAAGKSRTIFNPSTEVWYAEFSGRINTSPNAGDHYGWGISTPPTVVTRLPAILMGAAGSATTVNFGAVFIDGAGTTAAIDLGVALDNEWHRFAMWGDSVDIHFLIDDVDTGATIAASSINTPTQLTAYILTGGVAHAVNLDTDYYYVATTPAANF